MDQQGFEATPEAEELYARFLADEESGEAPSFDEFCEGNAAHAAGLRRLRDADLWWQPFLGDVPPNAEVPELLRDSIEQIKERVIPFERYVRRGELEAKGGQGRLLQLWDSDLRRIVLQKLLKREPAGRWGDPEFDPSKAGRLLDEARITGRLEHPGIVPVHELGLTPEGDLYFTMKQVSGRDLDEVFAESESSAGTLSRERVLGMLLRACEALAYAHDVGVVHRDLKPENIRVGEFGEVYVIDWGLARFVEDPDRVPTPEGVPTATDVRWTMEGVTPGTCGYLAPERARGDAPIDERRADVYGMGAVLYRWLTGRRAYHGVGEHVDSQTYVKRLKQGPPRAVHELGRETPAALAAICAKAMAYDPRERYVDMRELAADLSAFLEQRTVQAYRTGAYAELAMWARRNRGIALAAGLALIVSIGALLLTLKSIQDAANMERSEWLRYRAAISSVYAYMLSGRLVEASKALEEIPANRQGWEARHLAACLNPEPPFVYTKHQAGVRLARISPTGDWAASVSDDGSLHVWSLPDGTPLFEAIDHGESVRCLAIQPSGEWIATATVSGVLRIFSARDGSLHEGFGEVQTPPMNPEAPKVTRIAFFRDEDTLLTIGGDARLRFWDMATGEVTQSKVVTKGAVYGLAVSHDGRRIATSGQDQRLHLPPTVVIWDADSFEELERIKLPTKLPGLVLAFSPDDLELAIGADEVHRWRLGTQSLRTLHGHTNFVLALDYSESGDELVSGGMDKSCRVWDIKRHRQFANFGGHHGDVRSVQFGPEKGSILSSSFDGTAQLWSFTRAPGMRIETIDDRAKGAVAISPSGALVAAGSDDYRLHLWSGPTRTHKGSWDHHSDRIDHVVFLNDRELVTASADDTVRRWTIADEMTSQVIAEFTNDVPQLALSPERHQLAAVSRDGSLRAWEIDSWAENSTTIEGGGLSAVEFSPDGAVLALGDMDGEIRLIDAFDFRQHRRLTAHSTGEEGANDEVLDLCFLSNGELLSAGDDGRLLLHELETGATIELSRSSQALTSVVANPDATRFFSAGWEGTLKVWDAKRRELLLDMPGRASGIARLALGPDGRELAASCLMGEVVVFESAPVPAR